MGDSKTDANEFYRMALWYAFGRLDSGEYAGKGLSLDAFEFADSVRAVRLAWCASTQGMFESIQGQWSDYVAGKSQDK
jgi:hypothetical protein